MELLQFHHSFSFHSQFEVASSQLHPALAILEPPLVDHDFGSVDFLAVAAEEDEMGLC